MMSRASRWGGKIRLEDIFYSKVSIRIISHLLVNELDSESNLIRISRTNYNMFKKHIEVLIRYGVVVEKRLGRIKVYMLNKNSSYYHKLKKIYSIWNTE